ncbi:MAG: phage recombination protein Bet [Candidatus Eremiobacteraeota bacterium]|nr:phage recombination protein Bet [Candidatus Eremiobacteraeota bacterium]
MSSALVVADRSASAIISASGFTREQVDLVKSTVAVGATDMELALFLQVAKHRGLDVFTRQIHFVKRRQKRGGEWVDVGTIQTGIDGFRLIAERTGKSDGQDDAEFEYEKDGRTLRRASVRVYRKDVARPFVGSAYWAEYADLYDDGNPKAMWKRMPHVMLAKCAEALALRKAYPENLSGLYTDDEMPTIEGVAVVNEQPATTVPLGTASRMPEQRAEPTPGEPLADDTLPPADADAATLRAWFGKRLAFRTKSWTAEQMTIACREIEQALGLALDAVTPRTLGDHLVAYRNAVAAGPSAAQDAAQPVPATADTPEPGDAPPAPAERPVDTRGAIIVFLAEHGIANDDTRLQEMCGHITTDSTAGVRYAWESLDDAEMARLLAGLEMIEATGDPGWEGAA